MAPTLALKALERAGVPPVGCGFLSIFSPLAIMSLVSTCCSPCSVADRCTAGWGSLSQTSLAIMGGGAARSAPVHPSPPMASLSGAIWGAGWAVALSCPCQGSHQFGNLVLQFCSALYRVCGYGRSSPYLIAGFLIFTLPCRQQSSTGNKWSWGYYRDTLWYILIACGPHGRDHLWVTVGPLDLSLFQGTAT